MFNYELEIKEKSEEAITRVIVFFDLFDYPLSASEIWDYLDRKLTLLEIIKTLENSLNIKQKNGFYFLKGRDEIIKIRQARHNYSLRKIKIAYQFGRLFFWLPFIKVIALANSIGRYNLRDASDIDFFIITAPGRIWLTRLICAGMAKILNRRPTTRNKKDKICLSFYITTENLNLDGLKLKGDDPYFFFWLRSLVLLYNKNSVYEDFLIANNLRSEMVNKNLAIRNSVAKSLTLNYLENLAKRFQLIIMSPALKRAMNNSVGVVISDKVLKLYLFDKRQEYAEKYGNKICQVIKKSN